MNGYRNGPRYDRIDQEEVPESKHTVFIRGLPGHIKSDEVKDFFEDHVGPCSFDFIKLSQDQLKLFVAVRFETRDAAKECMHKYKDGEVLGSPVEISWFRDIRRYVSYQQSQGLRPATVPRNRGSGTTRNRSSRSDYRDDDYGKEAKRKRTSSHERRSNSRKSRSESSSRSRSRTSRRSSRERSLSVHNQESAHSNVKSRSHSNRSSVSPINRNRGNSRQPSLELKNDGIKDGSTPPLPPSPAPVVTSVKPSTEDMEMKKNISMDQKLYSNERKMRKSKKKKRRKRTPSSSSSNSIEGHSMDEMSEGELRKKILKKREKAMKDEVAEDVPRPVVKPTLGKWEEQESVESSVLQNTTLKFGLESAEDIPKHVVRGNTPQSQMKRGFPTDFSKNVGNDMLVPPPPLPPRMYKMDVNDDPYAIFVKKSGKESVKKMNLKSEVASSSSLFKTDIDDILGIRTQANLGMFGSARNQPQVKIRTMLDDDDEPLQNPSSNLRLSSLTLQLNAETERERKLSNLTPELMNKYVAKKKQLENAFKADRETFGFVTKTLIQKDTGLEDRLRLALVEAIKDMEEAFTNKMDQYLDQLIMFISM